MPPSIKLDHIAFGIENMAAAMPFLVGELGGKPDEGGPGPEYIGAQWKYFNDARLEVITPASEQSFLSRFIAARGPGIHHATFIVPDLATSCRRAESLGYDVVGFNDSSPSWKEAFLHPKQALGIVVQFAESDPSAEGDWGKDFAFPDSPSPKAPAASIIGMRMQIRDIGRAERQWGELLEASVEHTETGRVFTWPDSPMRIAVDTDPASEEGPSLLEVASERTLALPDGRHEILGCVFHQIRGAPST